MGYDVGDVFAKFGVCVVGKVTSTNNNVNFVHCLIGVMFGDGWGLWRS